MKKPKQVVRRKPLLEKRQPEAAPKYEIIAPTYLKLPGEDPYNPSCSEHIPEIGRIIEWTGVPNHAMKPLNPEAEAAMSAWLASLPPALSLPEIIEANRRHATFNYDALGPVPNNNVVRKVRKPKPGRAKRWYGARDF